VAAEFFANATSAKRPLKLAAPAAAALVETWLAFPTLDITPALIGPNRCANSSAFQTVGSKTVAIATLGTQQCDSTDND
jgi:acetaldehyde dehydrogenase (acetylating)